MNRRLSGNVRSIGARLLIVAVMAMGLALSGEVAADAAFQDTTPPSLTPSFTPPPNANGWNNTQVTLSYTCTDSESGIDTAYNSPPWINGCPTDDIATAEGLTSFVGRHTRDLAGNYTFLDPAPNIRIDMTSPWLTPTLTPAPNANGWNNTAVTVSYICEDSRSGIDTDYNSSSWINGCPTDDIATAEGLTSFVGRHTRDLAGNYTFLDPAPNIRIDMTPPVVSVTGVTDGASYTLGQVPVAGCDTTDSLSQVATQASVAVTGGTPDGTGTFTATCSGASDNAGNNAASVSATYTVISPTNQAPTSVDAGGPYAVAEGSPVTLTASGSDPEGKPLTYAWDLDNDGSFETPGNGVTFSAAGRDGNTSAKQAVSVQVCDDLASCAIAVGTVSITNVAPTASFVAPTAVTEGSPISLALTNPADPSSVDAMAGFTYAFDCGDGSGYAPASSTATASCPTIDNGTRMVKGRITDKDGGATEYTAQVNIANAAPTVNPVTQTVKGKAVQVSATFSDNGTADTHTATWNWGDGSPSEQGAVSEAGGSGSVTGSHTYLNGGTYTITLTVTDKDGARVQRTHVLTLAGGGGKGSK